MLSLFAVTLLLSAITTNASPVHVRRSAFECPAVEGTYMEESEIDNLGLPPRYITVAGSGASTFTVSYGTYTFPPPEKNPASTGVLYDQYFAPDGATGSCSLKTDDHVEVYFRFNSAVSNQYTLLIHGIKFFKVGPCAQMRGSYATQYHIFHGQQNVAHFNILTPRAQRGGSGLAVIDASPYVIYSPTTFQNTLLTVDPDTCSGILD
eukprot:Awhi_evm1s2679